MYAGINKIIQQRFRCCFDNSVLILVVNNETTRNTNEGGKRVTVFINLVLGICRARA